jgi:predicted lipoprotein with Yx(FWY)xxD motif
MEQVTRPRRTLSRVSVGAAAAALALGVGVSSVAFADAAGASTTHKAKSLVIATAKNPTFGTILVSGNTVYTVKASKTACKSQCIKFWPEVLLPKGVKKAKAGAGVNASKLGTVKRSGGALQVTYGGKALYWFVLDTGPGQVHGNLTNTWGKWSVVVTAKPAANAPVVAPAPGATTVPTSASTTKPTSTTRTSTTTAPMTTPAPVNPNPAPTTQPPTPTTSPPPTTTPTTQPPTTTTTAPGGGGVGF